MDWLTDNLIYLIAFASVISNGFQYWLKYKTEMKQIRPQVVAHGCRVCGLQVYTLLDNDNKMSEPVCVYLAPDKSRDCKFNPGTHTKKEDVYQAQEMLRINNNKCYFSVWGDKTPSK
jgi:hypothetical protein